MSNYKERLWYVVLVNWHPARLNQLLYAHWAKCHRLKRTDATVIALGVLGAGVPRADTARRVSLEITLAPRQRAADPDAYWKSLLDGLVACGALVNDSHVWCELGGVKFLRGQRAKTVIRLENLDVRGRGPSGGEAPCQQR